MTSREKLESIKSKFQEKFPSETFVDDFEIIENDLDRLEKLEKANKLILDKVVDVNREVVFRNNYRDYLNHMIVKTYPLHYILSKKEWEFLKEVFG